MSRYCIDTSAYSRFQRGDEEVVEIIDRAETIGLPVIVVGELLAGFRLGLNQRRNEEALAEFTANPSVDVLTVDSDAAAQFADITGDLKRAGSPIPTNDIWIAATAARNGLIVLTYDDHFRAVARVGSIVLA